MKIKEGVVMDLQEEREAFECWFRTTATYKTLWDFISTHQTNIKSVFVKRNGKTYQNDCVQMAWEAWQAAKAKAVPKLTEKMIFAIEFEVENQLKASAIDADPFRLDGEKIWYAAIEAQESAK